MHQGLVAIYSLLDIEFESEQIATIVVDTWLKLPLSGFIAERSIGGCRLICFMRFSTIRSDAAIALRLSVFIASALW